MTRLARQALIALVFILGAKFSQAAPADCAPKTWFTPGVTGTPLMMGALGEGDWFAWWCPDPAQPNGWRGVTRAVLAKYRPAGIWQQVTAAAASSDPLAALRDVEQRFSVAPQPGSEAYQFDMLHYRACLALRGSPPPGAKLTSGPCAAPLAPPPPPPPPPYVVKPNSVLTSRPAFTLADGVRGTYAVGRAAVGEACDTKRPTLASGADLWAEFGPAFAPGVVALCERK